MKSVFVFILFLTILFGNNLERDDAKNIVIDSAKKLLWEDSIASATQKVSFKNAIAYCHTLSLSDLKGWRLPSAEEYSDVMDNGRIPSINTIFKYSSAGSYWIQSPSSSSGNLEWIDFADGSKYKGSGFEKTLYVRCVRNK